MDYHFVFSPKDSIRFLCDCVKSVISIKYKKPLGLFETKQTSNNNINGIIFFLIFNKKQIMFIF